MWNKRRSLLLSKACVIAFVVFIFGLMCLGPWAVQRLVDVSYGATQPMYPYLLATLYTGAAALLPLLYLLYRLLYNIGREQVFIGSNVAYLRRISWLCIVGACIALASSLYWTLWLTIAGAAAFVGLICRVLKNVLAEAVALKEENDYTI